MAIDDKDHSDSRRADYQADFAALQCEVGNVTCRSCLQRASNHQRAAPQGHARRRDAPHVRFHSLDQLPACSNTATVHREIDTCASEDLYRSCIRSLCNASVIFLCAIPVYVIVRCGSQANARGFECAGTCLVRALWWTTVLFRPRA